ncbi:hypothetical protein C2S52_021737 [Perilla frutescens var. hirtella]|nr:hypothetical protein C2S52_021737 [Perilla frutescens var. hirtella]
MVWARTGLARSDPLVLCFALSGNDEQPRFNITPPAMDKASAACRRLRHIILNKPTPIATVAVATSNTQGKFENLVDKFKKKSTSAGFRRKRLAFKTTVRLLAESGQCSHIDDILQHQKQYPDVKDEKFTARLISLYGGAKMLDQALQLFDEMPDLNCPRTVFSFNALLGACLSSENFDKLIELFQELPAKLSIEPNALSYTSAIKAFCKKELFDNAVSMLDEMAANGVDPDAVTFGVLLGGLYHTGRFSEGEKTWNLMREKNVVPDLRCYNSRIYGMMSEKRFSEAIELLKELEQKGLYPDAYTYNLVIKGFINEGSVDEVKKWHAALRESKTAAPNIFTYVTVIPFALDHGDIDLALELCKNAVAAKGRKLSNKIVGKVIDELLKQSKGEEAKELQDLYNLSHH